MVQSPDAMSTFTPNSFMARTPEQASTDQDSCRTRYLWLCQVGYAGRMIALGQCPVDCITSKEPGSQVQRALQVLINIIRFQIDEDGDYSNARLGSISNWFQQRFHPEVLLDCPLYDPLTIDEEDHLEPAEETFPEQTSPGPKPEVTDLLCTSRYELLLDLKKLLYDLQDSATSMEDTWKALWTHFIARMGDNEYLVCYQGGNAAAVEWRQLNQFLQARFMDKTFRLTHGTLTWWLQAHSDSIRIIDAPTPNTYTELEVKTTLCEVHIFTSYLRNLGDHFMDYVVDRGYQDSCARFEDWYQEVHDRSELLDSNCLICFLDYELQTEVTAESTLPIREPTKLACGHYVCLPCLKTWAQSDAKNHNKCPFCRTQTSPLNPTEKQEEILNEGMTKFCDGSSTEENVVRILQVMEGFLANLPVSIPSLHMTVTEEVDILEHWVSNITRPLDGDTVNFKFATDLLDSPSQHEEMRSWAALKSLHWSCERLRSYMSRDAGGYRAACQAQFRARVLFETLTFAMKLFDALLDFDEEEESESESDEEQAHEMGVI